MTYIGIDPGASGGLAAIDTSGGIVRTAPMPETDADVLSWFVGLSEPRAMLERVSVSPQMGVVSAGSFMRNYGALRMALVASAVPFDNPTPNVWQAAMGVRQKTGKTELGKTHAKDKNINKRRAQELFPAVKVTHAIADALLLAEYCRRLHLGMLR